MKKLIGILILIVCGCQTVTWVPAPNTDPQTFDRSQYECLRDSQQIFGSMYGVATIYNADLFSMCMKSKGFIPQTKPVTLDTTPASDY